MPQHNGTSEICEYAEGALNQLRQVVIQTQRHSAYFDAINTGTVAEDDVVYPIALGEKIAVAERHREGVALAVKMQEELRAITFCRLCIRGIKRNKDVPVDAQCALLS